MACDIMPIKTKCLVENRKAVNFIKILSKIQVHCCMKKEGLINFRKNSFQHKIILKNNFIKRVTLRTIGESYNSTF